MTQRKRFVAFAAVGLIATAACGFRAVAQNAENGDQQGGQQKKRMMQCPIMAALKSIQLHADSPAVLLGQSKSLELTAQQQEQLGEIAATARQRARDVLTDAQRQQLGKAPEGALSPMQLVKLQTKGEAGKGKGEMCPMCMKMMQQKDKMMRQKDNGKGEINGQR